ncbi:hypothetical protein DFQ27_008136 [Actinomortierella ambigua]|uniref:Uncharacterized protein n=1 Tax=Actinomortierella ambigua TaxID=1343610 RepID=A0A9P6PT10_9FUNG|nr:hypothetical protein DFQ27_008136 [Actinomortierella ambigua]
MASILFDDIAFPRELYDPDTLEFVAPISTLLSFTPHILSQLPLPDAEQEPLPTIPETKKEGCDDAKTGQQQDHTTPKSEGATTAAPSGFFATLKDVASSAAARKLVSDGAYLAGRFMDGVASSSSRPTPSSSHSTGSRTRDEYYYTRLRREEEERERASRQAKETPPSSPTSSSSSSYSYYNPLLSPLGAMFGFREDTSARDQERKRLEALEAQLAAFEREYEQQDMYSRREQGRINQERQQLLQALEEQKQRMEQLERAQQEEQEAKKRKQQEEEEQKKNKTKNDKNQKPDSKTSNTTTTTNTKDGDKQTDGAEGEGAVTKKKETQDPLVMAAVGVASLAMAMYATHRASTTYSAISFHDQLEMLLGHCQSAIQSAEAWMSEQVLEVPHQMREDVKMIKELMDTIHRLDPRGEKKAETMAWSASALGSLGIVGGVALSSMTAVASGGTLVVGCALYGIVSRAKYNGPEYSAARTMMELKAAQLLKVLGTGDYNPALQENLQQQQAQTSQVTRAKGGSAYQRRLEVLQLEFQRRASEDVADADEVTDLRIEDELRRLHRADRMEQSSSRTSSTSSRVSGMSHMSMETREHCRQQTGDESELLFDAGDLHGIKTLAASSTLLKQEA